MGEYKIIKKISEKESFYADVCRANSTTLILSIPKKGFVDVHNIRHKQKLKLQLIEILEEVGTCDP